MLWHGIGNFVWASGSGRAEVCGSREKLSGGERGAERQMRLLKARGLKKLVEVISGSATQGLWLENRKVGFQVVGNDRNRLPEKGTVGQIRRRE